VAVEPNYSCGSCALCREGNRNLCLSRVAVGIDVDGGFAQEATVPARCCWPAPAGLGTERLLMAEPLAVVVRAVGRAAPAAGETAAVLGVGSLGLLAVQVLRARGCRVLAVARTTKRLDLALALGAEAIALSGADDDTAAARAFSGREGVDLVIETAGTALAVEQAVNLCRPGGRVVLTGLPHEATALNFFWVVRRELRIIGSMIYQDEFPEAMRLLAAGAVRTDRLLSRTFPLDRIDDAFEAHRSPDSIKVAVIPPAG
jgi:threonine dehydrogenase-like Zn-dependent dehydrogenase